MKAKASNGVTEIKRNGVSVRVRPTIKDGTIRFVLDYYANGRRKLVWRSTMADARAAADEAIDKITEGQTTADCILSREDEGFTYNARVSRITPIQEHRMIVKAVNQGVPPERIAAALNLPLRVVKAFLNLLTGINAEAAELLKDKSISSKALQKLRQVNGVRQVEIAE